MPTFDNSSGPSTFFKGSAGSDQYPNPFYSIAQQYIPTSVEGQLWWIDHLLLRNGFFKAALVRIVSYFINNLVIECDSEELKKKYQEIFDSIKWKRILSTSGLNLLAYSNECLTVTQGVERFLKCNGCGNSVNIEKINNYTFNKGKYSWKCANCGCTDTELSDQPSKDIEKLSVIHWPLRQLQTRHDMISNQTDYYWQIPQSYIKNISKKNNKFSSKVTPKYVMDCVFAQGGPKLLRLNKSNLLHLKIPHPSSIETDGKAIPLGMFMFDDFFNYQTLKRFNEVICYEDINPFRVFSMMNDNSPQSSPVFNQNGGLWKAAIDEMIENHRRDPASYQSFPFPVNYQQLGGQGKQLAPVELMQQYKGDILSSYNIPQELFNMNLQLNTAGPALRLFENAWSIVPESLNEILQHIADIASKIYGYEKCKVSMLAVTISDDMERKAIVRSLVEANTIAKSEFLSMYGLNYEDQVRKKMQEDKTVAKMQQEEQEKAQLEQTNESSIFNQPQGGGAQQGNSYDTSGANPQDVLEQAQQIAQQLFPLDGAQRRQKLQEIKGTNMTLYSSVKAQLEQLTSQSKSQGVQAAKQQSQN